MLLRPLLLRLQALFATLVASRFETDALLTFSEQKADLIRQAGALEQEGLPDVAAELRQRAEQLTTENPLSLAVPALNLLSQDSGSEATRARPALPAADDSESTEDSPVTRPRRRRRTPSRSS